MPERAIYPTAPLVEAIRRVAIDKGYVGDGATNNLPGVAGFCEAVFGISSLAAVLKTLSFIGPTRADQIACRLGLHPCLIWGDAWWVPFIEDEEADEREHQTAIRVQRQREYMAQKKREAYIRKCQRKESAA